MKAKTEIRSANTYDQKTWDDLANHPLQSWAWGEFRKAMGIDLIREVVFDGQNAQPVQLTFHRIPYTPFTIGYVPKGPMITPSMVDKLTTIAKQKNAIFIQLEPNVTCHCEESRSDRDNVAIPQTQPKEIASLLARNDKLLRPSYHPLFTKYTFILDLTKSEDELLKVMHPKTRYNIRLAQKHGVIIKQNNTPSAFAAYQQLSMETTKRQGFYAHNPIYHQTMWDMLSQEKIASLWTAEYNGEILAAWILFLWKDTIYYPYGTSSRNHREVMAPNLLLWEIMKWGGKNGYKKFDLWGALGPEPAEGHDPKDPWLGFHTFKEGYCPDLIEFAGSYDLVIQPFLYRVFCVVDDIRRQLLHLR